MHSKIFRRTQFENKKLNFVSELPKEIQNYLVNQNNEEQTKPWEADTKNHQKPDTYLRIGEKTILPPRSEVCVPIRRIEYEHDILAYPSSTAYNSTGILIPNMIVNSKTKCIVLVNPSDKTKILPKEMKIAKLDVLENADFLFNKQQEYSSTTKNKFDINQELNLTEKEKLQSLLKQFEDIFQLDGKKLGKTSRFKFTIDTGDSAPLRRRPYPHPEKINDEIKNHIDDLLKRGIIEPSQSPWASPCFLVPKKDSDGGNSGRRFVVDYRGLNNITKKNSYPLPRIEDVINRLRDSRYFTTLDLASGF